ncbi:CBS domain-containing protein [Candidatus Bathyarchaeota archaeon]|nr:CBS domain-containing protein [Candidatus Bathyarchaeota archaeon]MBS7631045.1 CBS domain-containing protein [Candidatus Bathyarchaeota archaeon]
MTLDLSPKMIVKEAMSSPVVTVKEEENVVDLARIMERTNVGAIVVVDERDNPLGIVTERDIVLRVVAKGLMPKEIKAKDVMSYPLKMVDPDMSLVDAMTMMSKLNIRRLGVSYKGKLVGIVTDRDILRIVPTIIEIVQERSRILGGGSASDVIQTESLTGFCDRCGLYSSDLRSVDGDFLCEDCRIDKELES